MVDAALRPLPDELLNLLDELSLRIGERLASATADSAEVLVSVRQLCFDIEEWSDEIHFAAPVRVDDKFESVLISYRDPDTMEHRSMLAMMSGPDGKRQYAEKQRWQDLLNVLNSWLRAYGRKGGTLSTANAGEAASTVGGVIAELRAAEAADKRVQESAANVTKAPTPGSRDAYYRILAAQQQVEAAKLRGACLQRPAVKRLQAICEAEDGKFDSTTLLKVRGKVSLASGWSLDELNRMTPAEFADAWTNSRDSAVTSVNRQPVDERTNDGTPAQAARRESLDPTDRQPRGRKIKRSTERGEGQEKCRAALTRHHDYAGGSSLKTEPIGNNELARIAGVAQSTAKTFFDREFDSHAKYRALCNDPHRLAAGLKALNGEFQPRDFYGARTPEEVERQRDQVDE